MCVCVCVLCFVLRGCVSVCVGVHIYINVYTNKTYIYKRCIHIYIYKLCKGMCFPRFAPSDPVWGRWCALVCNPARHCLQWERVVRRLWQGFFSGGEWSPVVAVLWQGVGAPVGEGCWAELCVSGSWIKHPLLVCGALCCWGDTNTVSSLKPRATFQTRTCSFCLLSFCRENTPLRLNSGVYLCSKIKQAVPCFYVFRAIDVLTVVIENGFSSLPVSALNDLFCLEAGSLWQWS